MTPPTPLDSVRHWFLRLPQLHKSLVLGGLGLLSGWVTTGTIHGAFLLTGSQRILVGDILLFFTTCVLGPGLAFGVLVAGPIFYLSFGTIGRWVRALVRVTFLHPVTFFAMLLIAGTAFRSPQNLPGPEHVAVVIVGSVFGYLLSRSCAPFEAEFDHLTHHLTLWVMGAAFGLIIWAEQRFQSGVPGMPLPVINLFRTASLFVTLHTAAAVCLSVRAWPELPNVAPPPLDEPATLPP